MEVLHKQQIQQFFQRWLYESRKKSYVYCSSTSDKETYFEYLSVCYIPELWVRTLKDVSKLGVESVAHEHISQINTFNVDIELCCYWCVFAK